METMIKFAIGFQYSKKLRKYFKS